jgi:hypothetical protein
MQRSCAKEITKGSKLLNFNASNACFMKISYGQGAILEQMFYNKK